MVLGLIILVIALVIILCYYCRQSTETDKGESISTRARGALVGEKLLCDLLAELTSKEVIVNAHPNFLRNPETRRLLELDCYIPSLRIGVEYQGIQHYQYPNHLHNTEEKFVGQLQRDHLKRQLCDLAGVHLIVVPCTVDAVKLRDNVYVSKSRSLSERSKLLREYLRSRLSSLQLDV